MKKILLAIMALMTFGGSAFAQDKFVVSETTIPQGGSAVMTVQLSNPKNAYGGFQFDIQLPPGFKATAVAPAKRITDMGVDFSLSVSQPNKDKNEYNILGYNTEMTNIVGTEGDLVYVTISADAMVALGEYEATIINQTMSTVDAKESTAPDMTVKLIVSDEWILDEKSPSLPSKSTKAVKVKVVRTIPANQWCTICLPFDMTGDQLVAAFGEGVQLAEFASSTPEKNDADEVTAINVGFNSVDFDEDDMYANTPYIIKVTEAVSDFSLKTTIDPEEEPVTKVKKNYFYGTMHAGITVPENSLFISGNNFWYSKGKTTIKGFRGYFTLNDVLADLSASAKINISVDGDATSIDGIGYQRVT